jgi:ribosomal protein S4E
MKRYLTIFLLVLVAAGCRPDEEPKNNTTIDYIRRTGRLWGVAELKLNDNGSITLIDAKSSGVGLNLMMRDADSKVVDSVTLRPGRSCSLSDGRHVFITYELKSIEAGRITFAVTDKFDARSFGNGIKETKETVTISPYKKQ